MDRERLRLTDSKSTCGCKLVFRLTVVVETTAHRWHLGRMQTNLLRNPASVTWALINDMSKTGQCEWAFISNIPKNQQV